MGYPVAYFEIVSGDPGRARRFYADLCGWTAEPDPAMGDYAMVDTGAGPDAIGGGIGATDGGNPAGVRIYVRVPDLEKTLARAGELGAPTVLPVTELPGGWGRIAVVADPDGNLLGLWA